MKKVLFLSLLFVAAISVNAQQKVALLSNGVTTIFGGVTPFVTAYDSAIDGDTIYLPGATLAAPPYINKTLAIIGAGHYPDSTTATTETILSGTIYMKEDADSLFLTGFKVNGNINFFNNHQINNVRISRVKANGITYYGSGSTPCSNNIIEGCVLGGINFVNATASIVTNCIITGNISNGTGNAIYNNVFTNKSTSSYSSQEFRNLTNCFIANNVITQSYYLISNCNSNTFAYNVFTTAPSGGTNTWTNNYNSVSMTIFLVNQTGSGFDYTHDYHLTSPATYVGTDSTQVGIYGGMYPYKTAAVPLNPHISSKSIPMSTDAAGMLNININVNAQDD